MAFSTRSSFAPDGRFASRNATLRSIVRLRYLLDADNGADEDGGGADDGTDVGTDKGADKGGGQAQSQQLCQQCFGASL